MNATEDEAREQTMLGKTVCPADLTEELNTALSDALVYRTQQVRDYDTANALWPGQSEDGRAWDKDKGKGRAWPWEGAHDTRHFLIDGIISEHVRIKLAAWDAAQLQASALRPLEGSASAKAVTTLLTWMFQNQLKSMARRQLQIAARWEEQYGYAIMGAWWEEKPRLTSRKLVFADMVEAAKAAAEQGDTVPLAMTDILIDPTRDEQAIQLLLGLSPILKAPAARRILRELRENGEADVPDVEVFSSLPRWRALRPWVDVFFPANMETIQDARWIARRMWLTEAQVRETALANDWDSAWVEDVCEHGRGKSFDEGSRGNLLDQAGKGPHRPAWNNPTEKQHLIEVVWFYTLGTHEEHQLPVMYLTVFCPMRPENEAGKDQYAFHGAIPDDAGMFPFVQFQREVNEHCIVESRSVSEVGKHWQDELKHTRDGRMNRNDVTNIPPIVRTGALAKTSLELGPGVQLSEKKGENLRWMPIPQNPTDNTLVTEFTSREIDDYFARVSDKVPAPLWQLKLKDMATTFLTQCAEIVQLTLKLAQQYLPETTAQRIADDPTSIFKVSREDIRGQYSVSLLFNAMNLDFEKAVERIKAYKELIIASDRTGSVNIPRFLEKAAQILDPEMAQGLIHPPEQAAEAQRAQAKAAWTNILAGIEPEMPPVGNDDYALQLQTLSEILANPANAERLKNNPDSAMLFQRFVQHLQFGLQQQENQGTGLRGVKPLEWDKSAPAQV